jgi:hypothetical protein
MINTVRNTVLSVLNKNNYGYLSPSDFNLFAKQAQMEIFDSYFYEYNNQVNKQNSRLLQPNRGAGTGIADILKGIEEAIDLFSVTKGLNNSFRNKYFLPSPTTTGSDYYLINKVLIYQDLLLEGETTAFDAGLNLIIDITQDFFVSGVSIGDLVAVENGGVQYVEVVSVDSATQITVTGAFFDVAGLSYSIFNTESLKESERVSNSKITMLVNSNLTAPVMSYPAYTEEELLLTAYPLDINSIGRVLAQYYRYPKDPKWTFVSLTNGEPMFNQSQSDYQDFELPLDDEVSLIIKICGYAGVMIREADVYQFSSTEESKENQQTS